MIIKKRTERNSGNQNPCFFREIMKSVPQSQRGKTRISLTKEKIRQINSSATSLVKTSLSRNFCKQKCEREFP